MNIMEIEVDSKKNNPLLNRTEIFFTVKHIGEKTPSRDVIRAELAEKINAKKEDVIIDSIHTTFGLSETYGYAKVYSSSDKLKGLEREHILVRNKLLQAKKKEKKQEAKTLKPAEGGKEEVKTVKEEPKTVPLKEEQKEKQVESQTKEKKE